MTAGTDVTVHGLVERQARTSPQAVAVTCAGKQLTYRGLVSAAGRVAGVLTARGIGPGRLVGVHLDRSVDLPVVLLAILQTGAAYLPLDPGYPLPRLRFMIDDARPSIVVSMRRLWGGDLDVPVVLLDELPTAPRGDLPAATVQRDDLAYVMYTSGSTGTPRGVDVPHRAIVNLVRAGKYIRFTPGEVFLQAAPLAFDASTFEIWGALANGARLVLFPGRYPVPAEIGALIQSEAVTTVWLTAGLFHHMVEERLDELRPVRQLIAGGDVLSPLLVSRAIAGLPQTRIVNGYGPTEATTFSTCHEIGRPPLATPTVPIGRPITNVSAYVLDEDMNPVEAGIPGDLYVGGAGVARGYRNLPALTAAKFLPDPFSTVAGARMYHTGDRVRSASDGVLEFLGRRDGQVKLRGFRIELGEVESALRTHPDIHEAVVIVSDDQRLAGYVTGTSKSAPALRSYLAECLPDFMVPSVITIVETLPLTANGKIDRKALPVPPRPAGDGRRPGTPAEQLLADSLAAILGTERVDADTGLFELGVNSLQAMRWVTRVRDIFRVEVSVRDVFTASSVAGLAAWLSTSSAAGEAGAPISAVSAADDAGAMSFAQERLWILDQLQDGRAVYNVPLVFRLSGRLDQHALHDAFHLLVQRHEPLRTVFHESNGVPHPHVGTVPQAVVETSDLSALPRGERDERLHELLAHEVQAPFDLARGPLLRVRLVRMDTDDHVLAVTAHHIAIDGWSHSVMCRELSEFYQAAAAGRPVPQTAMPVTYQDFARWQRAQLCEQKIESLLGYWRPALEGMPSLQLPTIRSREPVASHGGRTFCFTLSPKLTSALRDVSRDRSVTLFMTLLAAFQVLLGRYSGQSVVPVGTPIAGRDRPEVEPLIGFFVNTLVLRGDLAGNPAFGELLDRVRETTLDAYAHRDLPFERLVDELGVVRAPDQNPLVQVFFALQNTPEVRLDLPGIAVSGIQPEGISSKFDLALLVAEENHGLRATVEYSTDLFDEGTVQRLAGHYETLLAQIVRAPDTRLADLHLLTPAEQDQFDQWNDTAKPPVDTTVHMLVTAQARRSPSSVAVSCAGRQLTYAELDSRANQLARVLRDHGAGTERLVGVCMDRSIELPVALLAVLKSGSAYLPLEPTYPNARLVTVIDDARPSIIVSTSKVSARLPRGLSSPVLLLDNDLVAGEMAAASPAPLPDVSHPDNLAYVMYTSGSTGSPKGVAVTHRGIVRLTTDAAVAADDVFLLLSTFAFDASTWEIWCSLGNGARLAVFPPDLSPIDNLETVLRRERVTMLFLTTGLFHELVDGRLDILRQVRHIWAGGDVMSVPAAERALAGMPETRVTNVYGPTETVTYSTTHLLGPATTSARSVPIGEPVANTQIHVLDGNMNRVPAGVPGELYVGGDKVARGYLDRPMLTAERFVPNPFGVGRLYRTGDRARYRPDGSLDFLGRLDNQVKIRGYRVEPEEIEAALRRHPLVQEAVVTVLGNDSSARVLVGTVLSTVIGTDRPDLRSFLAERLPEFMVPTRIRILQSVPMTPSGKVDRLAIARQEEATPMVADAPEPPADGVESALAGIWAEVLGTGAVGVQQNFFELGGNSLLLARVRNRIQDLIGRDVPLIEFFRYPTVAELARYLAGSAGPAMKIGGGHEQLRAGRERASRLRTLRSSGAGGA